MPCSVFFFFNDTATTEIYTLSLHDALPISGTATSRGSTDGTASARTAGPATSGAGPASAVATYVQNRAGSSSLRPRDRKSTRLNSSHANISYAVFCLKKKKKHNALEENLTT